MKLVKRLLTEEKGQGLVEYVLIIALIAVVVITILTSIGNKANNQLTTVDNAL